MSAMNPEWEATRQELIKARYALFERNKAAYLNEQPTTKPIEIISQEAKFINRLTADDRVMLKEMKIGF